MGRFSVILLPLLLMAALAEAIFSVVASGDPGVSLDVRTVTESTITRSTTQSFIEAQTLVIIGIIVVAALTGLATLSRLFGKSRPPKPPTSPAGKPLSYKPPLETKAVEGIPEEPLPPRGRSPMSGEAVSAVSAARGKMSRSPSSIPRREPPVNGETSAVSGLKKGPSSGPLSSPAGKGPLDGPRDGPLSGPRGESHTSDSDVGPSDEDSVSGQKDGLKSGPENSSDKVSESKLSEKDSEDVKIDIPEGSNEKVTPLVTPPVTIPPIIAGAPPMSLPEPPVTWSDLSEQDQNRLYDKIEDSKTVDPKTGQTTDRQSYVPEAVDWALNDGVTLEDLLKDPQILQDYVNKEIALRDDRKKDFDRWTAEWEARIGEKQRKDAAAKFMEGADVVWTKPDIEWRQIVNDFNKRYKEAPSGQRIQMWKEFKKKIMGRGRGRRSRDLRRESLAWDKMTPEQRLKMLEGKARGSEKSSTRQRGRRTRKRR